METIDQSCTATLDETRPTVGRPPIWYTRVSEKHTMSMQLPKVLREALDRAASEKGVKTTEHMLDILLEASRDRLPADLIQAYEQHLEARD